MILGMAWAIILDYAIKGINVDDMTVSQFPSMRRLLFCYRP